jgi:hypothetical protein
VFSAWKALTDPDAFQAGSASVVSGYLHASDCERRLLGRDDQIALASRLRRVPSPKVNRLVRKALYDGRTDEERLALVIEVLDTAGKTAPPPSRTPSRHRGARGPTRDLDGSERNPH